MGLQKHSARLIGRLGVLVVLVVCCFVLEARTQTYPPSPWVADLTVRPASLDPSGFRPLPQGGFVFNAKASGDDVARRLVLFKNGAATPFALGAPREEPKYYYTQSDTIGDYLYFISATDHQIYRTMGRNASDVELVDIQVPQYKSNLFVFDNKLIFEGISFDGTNWLRDGGHWVWSPGSIDAVDFGLGTDMVSFCGSDRCEVASYASGGDYLIVSRYSSSAGRFKTSYTSRPSFSAPTSWVLGEDDPNAVIEAYPMRDVVCAAKRVRMLCQSNSTLYAKGYLYSGAGILINDTHMLLHFVTEYTTNLQTQIFRITTDVMNSGSHLNQPDLSFGVPPGATSYGDESTILRTGRWARLSPTMFLSDWPTDVDGVNVMRTFDISTRTFGNVTFSQPVVQFEIISSEQLGSSAAVYIAGRSPSGEWSLFKITISGSTVATNRVPALFTFPYGVPVASAVIVDRNDPSLIYFSGNTSLVGVTQLFSFNPSTGQRTEVPAPNYGNQGSVNVSNPFIQVWPFKAPGNASRQGLVDYAAVVVRTYDEITREYKLTLITGWTHPDDRCDISTETTAAGVTYHYARDVVEVVAAVNYAVLVIYDPTKAYPIRKIISRTCEPRVTMAIPPLFQESDRADSRFVSDVWCGDVLFFKGYVPIDSSRGDFRIISYHPDAGLASKSIQRNNVNYTNTYPLEIMDRRVAVSCLQSRQALVSHPSADRLRMTLFDRSRLSNINYDYVDDDSSVRDTLVNDASVRPAELVGRINNVLIFINGGHHIFGLRIGSNPSILRVNYSFPTAPTPPSWGYLPRSHPVRWLTLKNSAWYFHRDNHYVFRLHINDAGTALSAYQAINVHNDPFVVQTVQLPADWGVMIVTPFSPKTEFYVCPYNYFAAECWESAYTSDFQSVRFMLTFNDTLYWSEGSSPYDEQGTKIRSVFIDRTSPPETQWPNVQETSLSSQIPWAYSTVGLPDYSSSMWMSNGVRIMLLRTAFGVELVAVGSSLTPPLPRDIGVNSPLVYPIRIPPVPTCPGLPPQVDFVCINGVWTFYGSKNLTSQIVPLIGSVALKGNLTVTNVTFTLGTQGYLNVSECIDFTQGPLTLNISRTDLTNPTNSANGIMFGETLSACAQTFPQSFSISPQESTCESYNGQLQYANNTGGSDRVSMSVVFTVNTFQCQIWWIALASSLGGAVIIAVAIAIIAIKCCRKKIMPFSQRRE